MRYSKEARARAGLVVAVAVAVVVGVGTTPTVASHLVVRSSDIVNGQVRTVDLGGGAVTTSRLRDGAVTARKLRNGAVTKGKLAGSARVMWAVVETTAGVPGSGVIVAQSGGISVVDPSQHSFVGQRLRFPRSVQGRAIVATPITSALDSPDGMTTVKVAPCGPGPVATATSFCGNPGSNRELIAIAHNRAGDGTVSSTAGVAYYVAVLP